MNAKRIFDIFLSLSSLPVVLPLLLVLAILVRLTSKGPALHWSKRVGKNNDPFSMPKLRTMHINTPQVATHLLGGDAQKHLTPIGGILRKLSLDELPQIYSILKGDMSFVGPRPALFNQDDLIELRTAKGIHKMKPGLTGWAQINGRDDIEIEEKVVLDTVYLDNLSLVFDLKIIFLTIARVISSKNVSH